MVPTQSTDTIGRYRILRRIGAGGMASTYLCELAGAGGFQKQVVVKVMRPDRATDDGFVRMFLDEARLWARLDHPHIPSLFELGDLQGVPYFVMEYVPGPNLAQVHRTIAGDHAQRRSAMPHLLTLIADIARALDAAYHREHEGEVLHVVHRDVSLANVVASVRGEGKLIDFGIAKAGDRLAETEVGMLKGKVQYIAPEQLRSEPVDHRSDLFQLGVCLFTLLSGSRPFQGSSPAETFKARLDWEFWWPAHADWVPPEVLDLVARTMHPDPDERWQRGDDLAAAIDALRDLPELATDRRDCAAWVAELVPDWEAEWTTASAKSDTGLRLPPGAPTPISRYREQTDSTLHPAPPREVEDKRTWLPWAVAAGASLLAMLAIGAVVVGSWDAPPEDLAARTTVPTEDADSRASAFLDKAEELVTSRRFRDALTMVDRARSEEPADPDVVLRTLSLAADAEVGMLTTHAQRAFDAGDLDEARDKAREILDRHPEDQGAIALLQAIRDAARPTPRATSRPATPEAVEPAMLTVSTVEGATVYLDDLPIGTGSVQDHELEPGEHVVHVRKKGHEPLERPLVAEPGARMTFVLEPPRLPEIAEVESAAPSPAPVVSQPATEARPEPATTSTTTTVADAEPEPASVEAATSDPFASFVPVHHTEVVPRRKVDFDFPRVAATSGYTSGDCRVSVFVDAEGQAIDVRPEVCPAVFASTTEETLLQWRWKPHRVDGEPTPVRFQMMVRYRD